MNQIIDIIKDTLIKHTEIRAVSFDIFDTLLFRSAVVPDRVFWNMYHKNRKIFPDFTTIGDWVSSRKIAEKEARRTSKIQFGHDEVFLVDIYHHLPTVYSNLTELLQLEIACECEAAVLNTEIEKLVKYIYTECKKDIFLISDMYLTSEELKTILKACGLNLDYIKKIYVSSEFKCSKKDGRLYQKVLDEQHLCPNELFHTGDNLQSDILTAKQLGIHTCYYNFISEYLFKYPFLFLEQEFFDAPLCENMYLTRLFAGQRIPKADEAEKFFYLLGSMIIGPFLTYATEWVIDMALKENIHKIRPFMREGYFLSKMLLAAAADRNIKLSVKPLYISRLAAYSSRFCNITPKEISVLIAGAKAVPKDIFRILQIEDLIGNFSSYSNIPFIDLKAVSDSNGNSIYNAIFKYLSSPKILNIIHKRNEEKKKVFIDYLQQMDLLEPAITLDIGWNGTTMNAVYQAIYERKPESQLLQLLFCSSKTVAKNSVNGCIIKGFVGNYGGLQGKFNHIFIPIFELFCLCREGPTVGYEYQDGKVQPILEKNIYSEKWLSNIEAVQRGVMIFQEEYFKLRRKKNFKINLKAEGIQALSMIERLFSYPSFQEVELLRTAELDQNTGIENRTVSVLEDSLRLKYQELGLKRFYRLFRNLQQSITWHQALPTLNDPLIYLKMIYLQKAKYGKLSTIFLIEYAIKTAGKDKIVIVIDCLTPAVDLTMLYFKVMGNISSIAGIVSTNEYMQGIVYNGFTISPICSAPNTELYFIPIKERLAYYTLKKEIIEEKGTDIKIVGFFESD